MERTISAADANRRFSEIMSSVKKGESVVVTSHGKPIARIAPVTENDPVAVRAREALFARLKDQRTVKAGRWTRDELYSDVR